MGAAFRVSARIEGRGDRHTRTGRQRCLSARRGGHQRGRPPPPGLGTVCTLLAPVRGQPAPSSRCTELGDAFVEGSVRHRLNRDGA